MLATAVKARLPLINVTTRDPLSTKMVLDSLSGRKDSIRLVNLLPSGELTKRQILYIVGKFGLPGGKSTLESLESHYKIHEISVVVVNSESTLPPNFYDAGEMPTPAKLVRKLIRRYVDPKDAPGMMPALGGLTLKEVAWLIRIASTEGGEITRDTLTAARRHAFKAARGLQQINCEMGPYIPEEQLDTWAAADLPFFLNGNDPRLRPRGLLLAGDPGTGKTMAAKWLADKMGIPAYRLHCGSLFNKYVGETEKAMMQALAQVDRDEPCVLLLDEVEKIFGSHGGAEGESITQNVLGELLWWLQEHTSRVLTIMTTNAIQDLPPELYRPGRVDATMTFEGVAWGPAVILAKHIAASYDAKLSDAHIGQAVKILFAETTGTSHGHPRVTQAAVSAAVVKAVKVKLQG